MKQSKQRIYGRNLVIILLLATILAVGLFSNSTQIVNAASGGVQRQLVSRTSAAGATIPYTEIEAENTANTGTVIGPSRANYDPAGEASGRRAVKLSAIGQYVEFTLPAQANSIVVRYSLPDSANGSGITAPLSLYIGGVRQTDLSLTSRLAWRYGGYQFTNNPGDGHPFQMYDEVHRLTGQMAAGTKVRLQMDSGDTAPSYTIDFADFEQVAAPISQPAGYLSVTDYGADPSGAQDSTTAIRNAINDGKTQGKGVYLPQGTYTLTGQLQRINNVTIQGAGMWYSTLHFTATAGSNTVGVYGNYMPSGVTGAQDSTASQNVKLSDFAIFGEDNQRVDGDQDNGIGGAFSNSTIQNIWIEHTKCGLWLDGPMDKLTIQGLRIRDVIADGVNFHIGVTNSTVTNSDLRNTGDDGLAMWSETQADANSSFTNNNVRLTPFANEIAIYGGSNNSMTGNYIADGPDIQGGGLHVGNRFGAVALSGTTTIANNVTVRSGALDPNWQFGVGALWFYGLDSAMTGTINVTGNQFLDSSYEAIMFMGSSVSNVTFSNNTIDGTGTFALQLQSSGSASFSGVSGTHIGSQTSVGSAIYSCMGTQFTLTKGTGNGTWINDTPFCGPWPAPVYVPLATSTPTPTNTPCPGGVCPTNTPVPPTATPSNTPTNTPTPSPVPGTVVKAINAGGGAVNNWVADTNFDLGNQFSDTSTTIDTSGYLDTNPAPQAVYQTCRWNAAFTYTIPGLTAGAQYTVLLHWAELSFQAVGSRKFNVAINSVTVLSGFDVYAAAGYKHAISKNFAAVANSSGQIVIAFSQGGADNPFISGIEILSQSGPTPTRTPTGTTPTFVPPTNTSVAPTNTPVPTGDGSPWNGTPASLPGKVEAENYNTGGEGIAYHDNDTVNNGGQYRTSEGVDVEGTGDTGGGYNIGWTNPGEWEKYTVNVTTAGTYNIDFRVASNAAGGSFHLEVDGNNVTGTMSVPVTGAWQTWTTISKTGVSLTAGQHVLRWYIETAGGSNLNWINFSTGSTPTATPQPLTLVKAINAGGAASGSYVADTNFDVGNQYSDTSTSINTANDPNPAPQSVYQTCRWNASFTYTIPGLTAGATYTVRLHWAELTWQAAGQRKFNVAINGSTVLSAFDVFATGGYKSAVARSFTTTANSSGQIVIAFSQGGADNPFISGIEILH